MTEQELEERISNMIDNHYDEMAERFENELITAKVINVIYGIGIESEKGGGKC